MAEIDFDTIDWEQHPELLEEEGSDVMERAWRADIGLRWAQRNPTEVEDTDMSFLTRYGSTKTWLVRDALRSVPTDAHWLEVGCAAGAHMRVINAVGYEHVVGVDMNFEGMSKAPQGLVAQSRARDLPFGDLSVDGIATSGTLIHLGPPDMMRACVAEFARVSRRWLFFVELWSAKPMVLVFGAHLLPPAWSYPWEHGIPELLPDWQVRYCQVHKNAMGDENDASSVIMLLMERR